MLGSMASAKMMYKTGYKDSSSDMPKMVSDILPFYKKKADN